MSAPGLYAGDLWVFRVNGWTVAVFCLSEKKNLLIRQVYTLSSTSLLDHFNHPSTPPNRPLQFHPLNALRISAAAQNRSTALALAALANRDN